MPASMWQELQAAIGVLKNIFLNNCQYQFCYIFFVISHKAGLNQEVETYNVPL
jgi:hypothetical protein